MMMRDLFNFLLQNEKSRDIIYKKEYSERCLQEMYRPTNTTEGVTLSGVRNG